MMGGAGGGGMMFFAWVTYVLVVVLLILGITFLTSPKNSLTLFSSLFFLIFYALDP